MKRRWTHAHRRGEIFDARRAREIRLHAPDCLRDLLRIAAGYGDLRNGGAMLATQHAVVNLAHHHRREDRDVLRGFEQPCEAQHRVDHRVVELAHEQAAFGLAVTPLVVTGLVMDRSGQQIAHHRGIEMNLQAQIRPRGTRFRHLAEQRQID